MKFMIVEILLVALVGSREILGQPQERAVPEETAASVKEEKKSAAYEDSVAAASETGDPYDDHDDSDMFMEPDGAESSPSNHRQEPKTAQPESPVQVAAVVPVQTMIHVTSSESSEPVVESTQAHAEKSEDRQPEESGRSLETDSQNFFPSFAELFGNQRIAYADHQQQAQRYRPSRFLGYYQRDRPYQASASASSKEPSATLLGSGNFGVIQGGTYYPEDRTDEEYGLDDGDYPPYYRGGGARGRSNYYKNPKPQPVRPGGDFFANFRDFADITAPAKSSFSHLSVVYAAKNGEARGRLGAEQPRNIFETLRMLEEQDEVGATSTTTELPTKKPSQGKRKLAKWKKYQEEKARKSRTALEPLIALS